MAGLPPPEDIFYWSWRVEAPQIISPIRNQLQKNSCPHHGAGAAVEMRTKLKRLREGKLHQYDGVEIDIGVIEELVPPVRSLNSVMESITNYGILSTNKEEVFFTESYTLLTPKEERSHLSSMYHHLMVGGPLVGSFSVNPSFRPHRKDIYLCEDEIEIDNASAELEFPRHVVAIVGFGVDKNYNLFWEYLESYEPIRTTIQSQGFARMGVNNFDKVYVPHVA